MVGVLRKGNSSGPSLQRLDSGASLGDCLCCLGTGIPGPCSTDPSSGRRGRNDSSIGRSFGGRHLRSKSRGRCARRTCRSWGSECGQHEMCLGVTSSHSSSPVRTTRRQPGGAADSNTIAVSHEIVEDRNVEYLAALLAHEWHHVKQAGDSPETPGEGAWPAPFREYAAYRAQYLFMCSLMSLPKAQNDDGVLVQRPFPCSALRYSELLSRWHDCVNENMGGSPAISPVPASCGSLYCEK